MRGSITIEKALVYNSKIRIGSKLMLYKACSIIGQNKTYKLLRG